MRMYGRSRRLFLQGAGGATLALPFLESLLARGAAAALGAAPKRFIALKTYNHPVIASWYPTVPVPGTIAKNTKFAGTSKADGTLQLTKRVESGSAYCQATLADFVTEPARGISTVFGPAFNRHLPKLTLIRGLDFLPDTNHNYSGFLGNYASCDEATRVPETMALPRWPTIDQVLAYSTKFYPTTPALRSLHVGQGIANGISWSANGDRLKRPVQLQQRLNPLDAHTDAFGGFTGPGAGSTTDGGRLGKQASVVDRVFQDYRSLRDSRRLSAGDRELLDGYMTLMTELAAKLRRVQTSSGCAPPGAPASLPNSTRPEAADVAAKWEAFTDTIVAAIMCDRSRIFTLDVRTALVRMGAGVLYHNPDGAGGWHGAAHKWDQPGSQSDITDAHIWVAQRIFLELIRKLDVPESGGATYLDNSLIYWGGELGMDHINLSVHCMLAGSAGGFIKTGRYLDYVDWDHRAYFGRNGTAVIRGIPHNQLCVSILQAMGQAPADYERPGIPGFGERTITGKKTGNLASGEPAWPRDYDFSRIGEILPGLRS